MAGGEKGMGSFQCALFLSSLPQWQNVVPVLSYFLTPGISLILRQVQQPVVAPPLWRPYPQLLRDPPSLQFCGFFLLINSSLCFPSHWGHSCVLQEFIFITLIFPFCLSTIPFNQFPLLNTLLKINSVFFVSFTGL